MLPDVLSAVLRGLSFIAMAQAVGAVLFLLLFESGLGKSRFRIHRAARSALVWGLILVPVQFLLEAARMSGSLSGLMNWDLQAFSLSTVVAKVAGVRVVGLVALAVALQASGRYRGVAAVAGVILITGSFALMGHTTMRSVGWLLAPAIVLHVLIAAFWFGSLRPLILVVQNESSLEAARVVEQFSRIAVVAVPLILLAGLLMTIRLLPEWQAISSPYGLGLLGKMLAFAVLMGLAALNKWRLGPVLARGGDAVARRFCMAAAVEWLIIALVLLGTAMLTTFLSPSG
jgi:putative copper export protein